jgi:hypothetical protein
MLRETWPDTNIDSGGLDQTLAIDIHGWREDNKVAASDVKKIVVRGHVATPRSEGGRTSERQFRDGAAAVLKVFYPADPTDDRSIKEIKRIEVALKACWEGHVVKFDWARRAELSPGEIKDAHVMEFAVLNPG